MNKIKDIISKWYNRYEQEERVHLEKLDTNKLFLVYQGEEIHENRANGTIECSLSEEEKRESWINIILISTMLRVATTEVERNPNSKIVLDVFFKEYYNEEKSYNDRNFNTDHFDLDKNYLYELIKKGAD